jgi:ankyrin repeat protein
MLKAPTTVLQADEVAGVRGPTRMVRLLLRAQCVAISTDSSTTFFPLHLAAKDLAGDVDAKICFRLLLEAYPEAASTADSHGWLPLHTAVRHLNTNGSVNEDAVKCLDLLLNANPAAAQQRTPEGSLPLHLALEFMGESEGASACIQLLLSAHKDAAMEADAASRLPLHLAARFISGGKGAHECMELLLSASRDAAKTRTRSGGQLPLHFFAQNEAWPPAALAQLLTSAYPAALVEKDDAGRTPLRVAEECACLPADALDKLRRLTKGETGKERDLICYFAVRQAHGLHCSTHSLVSVAPSCVTRYTSIRISSKTSGNVWGGYSHVVTQPRGSSAFADLNRKVNVLRWRRHPVSAQSGGAAY